MKLRTLLFSSLSFVSFSAFSQVDTSTSNKAAKADVLIQKKTIYHKEEVKNTDPKTQVKKQRQTTIKKKHKRHKWKRKKQILKK